MKKITTLALSTMILSTLSFGVDIKTTFNGDMKAYYGTSSKDNNTMFQKESSVGNIGLSFDAYITAGEDTSAGVKAIFLDTAGLEGSVIRGGLQTTGGSTIALTEAFLTRKFGNTGVIIGRQGLVTPMLFSETSNVVYKNTFSAFTIMNKSLEKYTFIGSIIGGSNDGDDLSKFDTNNMGANMYMLAALMNPMNGVTASGWYYKTEGKNQIVWGDVSVDTYYDAKVSLQGALIEKNSGEKTSMYGVKTEFRYEGVDIVGAYNYVDRDIRGLDLRNRGTVNTSQDATSSTTSLFTQMFSNTGAIAGIEGDTTSSIMLSAQKEFGSVNYKFAYGTNFDKSEYDFSVATEFSDLDIEGVIALAEDNKGTYGVGKIIATYRF